MNFCKVTQFFYCFRIEFPPFPLLAAVFLLANSIEEISTLRHSEKSHIAR